MYLHIGSDQMLSLQQIISIHDIRIFSSEENKKYFLRMEKAGKVFHFEDKKPKSAVLTEDGIYLSAISSLTLKRRAGLLLDDDKYGTKMEEEEI